MFTEWKWTHMAAAGLMVAGLVACADAPSAPVPATEYAAVAAAFDNLADEAALAGDIEKSVDWRWVAKAIRAGYEPSKVEISTFGKMEEYNAFVRGVEPRRGAIIQTGPKVDVGHTMFAWQRHNSDLINHAVRLFSPGDEMGGIVPRTGIEDVVKGAHADYFVRGAALGPFIGFKGIAAVVEKWAGARCNLDRPPELERLPEGVVCNKAHYRVRFEATFRPMHEEPGVESHIGIMWMAEQKVVGVKFTPTF